MKVADLSPEMVQKISEIRYDRILEKHEGPWKWKSTFEYGNPEFMLIDGHDVLLPVGREQHLNITILRCIASSDAETLTVFFKDTTYYPEPEHAFSSAGYLAICEKMPESAFFIATVYHEWFMVENPVLRKV